MSIFTSYKYVMDEVTVSIFTTCRHIMDALTEPVIITNTC